MLYTILDLAFDVFTRSTPSILRQAPSRRQGYGGLSQDERKKEPLAPCVDAVVRVSGEKKSPSLVLSLSKDGPIKGMNVKQFYVAMALACAPTVYATESTTILNKYQQFLEQGTYADQDWTPFPVLPKSRYHSFKAAFEHFELHNGHTIVELGTTRSFVGGPFPGCNEDNPIYWEPNHPEKWDWGAGSFTRVAAECLAHLNPTFHTVDLAVEHINRCKLITRDFSHFIQYHVCSSLAFLHACAPQSIDLLYMDTGNMHPIEPTARMQLAEAQVVVERNLISPYGIILIDDIRNQTPKKFGDTSELGKGKYAIPYLLAHGFELVINEYQVLLKRKSN